MDLSQLLDLVSASNMQAFVEAEYGGYEPESLSVATASGRQYMIGDQATLADGSAGDIVWYKSSNDVLNVYIRGGLSWVSIYDDEALVFNGLSVAQVQPIKNSISTN